MEAVFKEGVCCGDCAKCIDRPKTTEGIQTCAIANILPKLFCLHDYVVEQTILFQKILKQKDEDIEVLKNELKYAISELKPNDSLGYGDNIEHQCDSVIDSQIKKTKTKKE